MDCGPPGSSVHGISQTRVLEWVAISFSRGSCRPRHQTCVSCTAGSFFTTGPGKPNEGCLKLVAVQSLSPVRLCDPMDYSTPCFPGLHHFPVCSNSWPLSPFSPVVDTNVQEPVRAWAQESANLNQPITFLQTKDHTSQP